MRSEKAKRFSLRLLVDLPQSLSPRTTVIVLIAATAALRVWITWAVGLSNGESYYYSCAMAPALSYFDQPPMANWLVFLSVKALGANALAVRLPFIMLFAATTWLMFVIARRLFGPAAGLLAAMLLNLSAFFTLAVGCTLQPDGPLMFFYLACVYCLVRVLFNDCDDRDKKPRAWLWWCGVGVTLGLAMLSKYHAAFLVFGVGMFVITSGRHRRWLLHGGPYVAMAIAAAVFLPVLIWNARHEWISFLWQGGRGFESEGLRLDWLALNILGQMLYLLPWIWIPLLVQLVADFRRGPREPGRWLVAWLAVGPIVLFTAVSAYAPIGLHFHWQMPGYLLLFVTLGESARRLLARRSRAAKAWLVGSAVFTILASTLMVTHTATGWWRTAGPDWFSKEFLGPSDPTVEHLDYQPLAGALADRGLLEREKTFAFTNRWFLSGKVDWAVRNCMPVLCFTSKDPRGFAFLHRQEDFLGRDGVLVAVHFEGKWYPPDAEGYYGEYFERITPLGEVEVRRGGHVEVVLRLYLCENLLKPYPMPF